MNLKLFTTFFKIGLFTLGGGYAMIPMIEAEVVNKHKWLTKEECLDLIGIAQSCPGVFAANMSIYIGYKMNKKIGAVSACIGTCLPSLIIILAIAMFFRQIRDNEVLESIFRGIRPAVVALIAVPTFNMALKAKLSLHNIWIPIGTALLIWLFGVNPIYIIMITVVAGYLLGKLFEKEKA